LKLKKKLCPSSFEIISKLGMGSFSEVYLVKNLITNEFLALKVTLKTILN